MNNHHKKIVLLFISALVVFALGKSGQYYLGTQFSQTKDVALVQKCILHHQTLLKNKLAKIAAQNVNNERLAWQMMDSLSTNKTHYFSYTDTLLTAWSSQDITVPNFETLTKGSLLKKLNNGWYLCETLQIENKTLVALWPLKVEYSYQNKYLKNHYNTECSLNNSPNICTDSAAVGSPVYDSNNNYLCTLQFEHEYNHTTSKDHLFFIISLVALILLLIAAFRTLTAINNIRWEELKLLVASLFLLAIYLVFINFSIPESFIQCPIFSPSTFAVSVWLPSLAALLVLACLGLVFAFWFNRFYSYQIRIANISKRCHIKFILALAGALLLFQGCNKLVSLLIENSSNSSLFFSIKDFDEITFIGIFTITLLYISFALIHERIILVFKSHLYFKEIALITISITAFTFLIFWLLKWETTWVSYLFFIALTAVQALANRNAKNKIPYSIFVLIVFLFSSFAIYSLYSKNIKKEASNRELLIENLAFKLTKETDPIAEMYLSEIDSKISTDSILSNMMHQTTLNDVQIREYIHKTYFEGYWNRYETQVVTCWPKAALLIEGSNNTVDCYNYFSEIVLKTGVQLKPTNNFYFLDNENGRITYFGRLHFFENDPIYATTLYIEINSKPYFQGLGYPELLTSHQEQLNYSALENYSFAKYINNKVVKQHGSYRFPVNIESLKLSTQEKHFSLSDGMSHLIYHPNNKTTIILSRQDIKPFHVLLIFSSFFVLFFLLLFVSHSLLRDKKATSQKTSIQERMQFTFVGMMMTLLLIMGVSMISYSAYQFKEKNNQMLSQRLKSVLLELEQNVGKESSISTQMEEYLQYLLQKFSNVFYSDINLYSPEGHLIATSRPELYQKGLTGTTINPEAYNALKFRNQNEFIHQEAIGELQYTSAYIPIYNNNNALLGYLNLPYFISTTELKEQLSSLIIAVVNAYLLFTLFAIGLAVFVSQRITRPLKLIQERLGKIRLGKLNKKIEYKKEDEIGSLVEEYNRMVDELEKSAEKLARSEREYAWREMAQQIAHEIKNPLTPMKLSVQYLGKSLLNNPDDYDNVLERFSQTMIEQIDQLHIIANAFSNFAKMPEAKRRKVNIINKLQNSISLYEKSDPNTTFELSTSHNILWVKADPDQLLSIFNNLFKNAIQAIPNNRKGVIKIAVSEEDNMAKITICDNGCGISEEVKKKIFTPNFTTKSSGMGLGLAIVKNIVLNTGGNIWFETEEGVGSCFYIVIPIIKNNIIN